MFEVIKNFNFPKQMLNYMKNVKKQKKQQQKNKIKKKEYLLTEESVENLLNEYKKFFTMGLINKDFS
jgi:hypothetical protein